MERVLVSVKRGDEAGSRDIELPAEVESERLAEMIAAALGWAAGGPSSSGRYEIEARPAADTQGQGRVLQPQETLASAGIWDGSWLILRLAVTSGPPKPPSPPQPSRPGGPLTGFRPLGINLPPSQTDQEAVPNKEGLRPGFKWIRLDK